jgi:hypothetical protein
LGYRYAAKTFTESFSKTYTYLRLLHPDLTEAIENAMVDDPGQAFLLLYLSQKFIVTPKTSLCFDIHNFSLDEIKQTKILPSDCRQKECLFHMRLVSLL